MEETRAALAHVVHGLSHADAAHLVRGRCTDRTEELLRGVEDAVIDADLVPVAGRILARVILAGRHHGPRSLAVAAWAATKDRSLSGRYWRWRMAYRHPVSLDELERHAVGLALAISQKGIRFDSTELVLPLFLDDEPGGARQLLLREMDRQYVRHEAIATRRERRAP